MPRARKMTNAQRRPPGRPSIYNDELASKICRLVAEGYSIRQIGDLPQMPDQRTLKRWLAEKPTFQERYAQAKEEIAEHFAEEILEIADDGSNDWIDREVESGKIIKVVDHEHITRSRLRVDTRKWLMSKLMPKKFGDKLDVNTHIAARLTAMSPAERLAQAEELLQGAVRYLPLLEAQESERAGRLESEPEEGERADGSDDGPVPDPVESTGR